MIKYIQGDLFDYVTPKTIIPHICNSANKWGRGFVVPLMEHYMELNLNQLRDLVWDLVLLKPLELVELQ